MTRYASLVCGLLQSELKTRRQTIESIAVRGLPHDRVLIVCCAESAYRGSELAEAAYSVLAPLDKREAISEPVSQTAFSTSAAVMPTSEPLEVWVQSLDDYVRSALKATGLFEADLKHRTLACIVEDQAPVNFEELKSEAYARTWLGEPRAPGQLNQAKYPVTVGAGRNSLVPNTLPHLCSIQRPGVFFSFARVSDEADSIPLHLLDTDGCADRTSMSVKDLARHTGVPGDYMYGYEARSRLRVVAYRIADESDAEWSPKSIRKELLEAAFQHPALRSELASEFEKCREKVVGRLEARLANSSRRSLLKPRPGYLNGRATILEPTNEMETVWLAATLAPDIATVWAGFQLLDYTPRDGIDAVVRCRLGSLGVVQQHAVEFEYELRNFFCHAHPIHQVSAIICWTAGHLVDGLQHTSNLGGSSSSDMSFTLQSSGYCKTLNFGAHVIHVLCLDEFSRSLGYERV